MMQFIGLAVLLGALAALMLTRARWWPAARSRSPALAREVELLAQQLRQLEALHAGGALDAAQHAHSKAALERKLLDALAAPAHATPGPAHDAAVAAPPRPSRGLTAGLVLFLFAVAGGGYLLIGAPGALELGPGATSAHADAPEAAASGAVPHELSAEQMSTLTDRLAERLRTRPDDADGWTMLARSYETLGKHPQAVAAFAQAERLHPDDANLLADYADALAMTAGRKLDGPPTALVQRALAIDPRNDKALALAGTAAFDRKDYAAAVRYWETLAQVEPADGPFAGQVQGGIAEARRLAGMPAAAAASAVAAAAGPAANANIAAAAAAATESATDAAAGPGAQVAGTVTLAPALRGRVSPDDTLFVYARAADGQRMPLAVLRKRVADLPLRFTLDDSLAMSPAARLSGASRVIVGARISRSGNAAAQDGDLQAAGQSVAVGARDLRLDIDAVVAR